MLEDTIGTYMSVVPRALFAADDSMYHCSDKSQVITILEKEINQTLISKDFTSNERELDRVAIEDAMIVVQSLNKLSSVKTCKDLSDHFCRKMTQLFHRYEEIHLIFDRYDVESSLKTETRSRRLGSKQFQFGLGL